MVQLVHHQLFHCVFELDEIQYHPFCVRMAFYLHHQLIGMAVEMFAFAVIIGQIVRCVELEFLDTDHMVPSWRSKSFCRNAS